MRDEDAVLAEIKAVSEAISVLAAAKGKNEHKAEVFELQDKRRKLLAELNAIDEARRHAVV